MNATTLALVGAAIVVVALAITVGVLRWRKVLRDEYRRRGRHPVMTMIPPAPYEVSKGFRLLEPGENIESRPEPIRPSIDPESPYVFTDSLSVETQLHYSAQGRHDSRWALERSSHRSKLAPKSGRVIGAVIVLLVVLIGVGTYLQHSTVSTTTSTIHTTTTTLHPTTTTLHPTTTTSSTTTTTTATTTTTTIPPA